METPLLALIAAAMYLTGPTLLTVEGLRLPSQAGIEVRVFINKPDANSSTPITDPHYAGCFVHGEIEPGKPVNFVLEITKVLRRVGAREITVTVVVDGNVPAKYKKVSVMRAIP